MRKIRFFLLWLITLLIGYSISFASYTPNFANFKITNTYNDNSDILKVNFVLKNITQRPTSDYYMKLRINNQTYSSDLVYSSTYDTLSAVFSVNIDSNSLNNNYYVNYYIINNDTNTTKYTKTNYKINISNYNDNLEWSSIGATTDYNSSSEELKINFVLNGVSTKPQGNYYIKLKINNQEYTSDLIYSSSTSKFYSFFNVAVNKADLKSSYYITYSIINDDENVLLYTNTNAKLNVANKDNITWTNMTSSNSYLETSEELEMKFSLSNVKTKPKDTYYVKFKLWNSSNSTTYTSDLIYDPRADKLYTSFFIDLSKADLKNSYNVTYYVYNSKDLQRYSKTYTLSIANYYSINRNTYYNNNNSNCYNGNTSYYYNWVTYYCTNTSNNNTYYNDNTTCYNWTSYYYNGTRYCSNNTTYYDNGNNIYWYNMDVTSNYDNSNEELKISFNVNNITYWLTWDYYIKLYIDWKYYTSDLSYLSNRLYTTFYVNIPRNNLSSYYNYTYYVIDDNDDSTKYTSSNKTIYINNYNSYNSSNYYNDTDYYNYAWNKINTIENNYSSNSDRRYYLNKEIDNMNNNYYYNSNFKSNVINIFNNRINNSNR